MISYFLGFDREKKILLVKSKHEPATNRPYRLHIPAWRPGRYQLQNYARNIRNFSALSTDNKELSYKKIDKNTWEIETKAHSEIWVSYEYVADVLDAGSSYCDHSLVYINPVNCLMYGEISQPVRLELGMDRADLKIASGQSFAKKSAHFKAEYQDFHQLYDCPLIMSADLQTIQFNVDKTPFFFHYVGRLEFTDKRLKRDLRSICKTQVNLFGSFPEASYHFLLIIPAQNTYHGVEHRNSTMLVLGQNRMLPESFYHDLLGLASHELFHAWNICKIRPKELLPYDYEKESYFDSCFVAEGFTTYYGDKILLDSKVITKKMYYLDLETTLRRHFETSDAASQSLRESSVDLWVDGYQKPIANKRVSVYDKGAIVAFMIDTHILNAGKGSLDDVMRTLYERYGDQQSGYSFEEIREICETQAGGSLPEIFDLAISSADSILELCQYYLHTIGYSLVKNPLGQFTLQKV